MKQTFDGLRRQLLKTATLSVALMPIATIPLGIAFAADLPLLSPDDSSAKSLNYVSDATKSSGATPGSKCANCAFYQGASGSAQGGCPLFPGKSVEATGWCSAWALKG